jgi:glucose/arabinose dehydrogenase
LKLDEKGNYEGAEDFISGWLTSKGTKLGRPVDILVLSGGTAYISDDSSGVVYKLSR